MTAVIWTDVIQLVVYLVGAVLAAVILLREIPGGWTEVHGRRGRGRQVPALRLHLRA